MDYTCEDQALKTFEHNGSTIHILFDQMPSDPRDDDNLGTMVCFHRRYALGDKNHGYKDGNFHSWKELEGQLYKDGAAVVLPLYMYDHSIQDIATEVRPYWWHYSWDGGQIGFIFITKEKARKEYGWKNITPERQAELKKYLKAEVDVYAKYVRGETYGYSIETPEGEEIESCYGYLGLEDCETAAKEACPKPIG
jgi:hypothetical protein